MEVFAYGFETLKNNTIQTLKREMNSFFLPNEVFEKLMMETCFSMVPTGHVRS